MEASYAAPLRKTRGFKEGRFLLISRRQGVLLINHPYPTDLAQDRHQKVCKNGRVEAECEFKQKRDMHLSR